MDPGSTGQAVGSGISAAKKFGHKHNPAQERATDTERFTEIKHRADQAIGEVQGLLRTAHDNDQPVPSFLAERAMAEAEAAKSKVQKGLQQFSASYASTNPISTTYHTVRMTNDRKDAERSVKDAESQKRALALQMEFEAEQMEAKKKQAKK